MFAGYQRAHHHVSCSQRSQSQRISKSRRVGDDDRSVGFCRGDVRACVRAVLLRRRDGDANSRTAVVVHRSWKKEPTIVHPLLLLIIALVSLTSCFFLCAPIAGGRRSQQFGVLFFSSSSRLYN
jgi:hypothetical protein